MRQGRLPVPVQDDTQLCSVFQSAIGTDMHAAQIADTFAAAAAEQQNLDDMARELDELADRRQELEPQVAVWQEYDVDAQALQRDRLQAVRRQLPFLESELSAAEEAAGECRATHDSAEAAEAAAQHSVEALEHEQAQLEAALKAASRSQAKAGRRLEKLAMQRQECAVQAQAAATEHKAALRRQKRLQKSIAEKQRSVHAARSEVEARQPEVAELAEAEAVLVAQLQAMQDELAGSGRDVSRLTTLKADIRKCEAQLQQWAVAQAAQRKRVSAQEAKVQRVQDKVDGAAAAVGHHDKQGAHIKERESAAQALLTRLEGTLGDIGRRRAKLLSDAASAQARVNALQQELADPAARSGGSRSDDPVAALHRQSAAGKIPGTVFGRFCDLAMITDVRAAGAVNAVLSQLCKLGSTIVVSSRQTARHVISHYAVTRAGVAHCKIVDENKLRQMSQPPAGMQPLMAYIGCRTDDAQALKPLQAMLATWALVPDRQAAIGIMARSASAGYNLATPAGEIFKADGEVVTRHALPRHAAPYVLTCADRTGTEMQAATAGAELQKVYDQLQTRISDLDHQISLLEKQQHSKEKDVRAAQRALDALRRQQQQHKEVGSSLCAKLSSAKRSLTQAQKELATLRTAIRDDHEEAQLETALNAASAAHTAACRAVAGDDSVVLAEMKLHAMQQRHAEIAAAAAEAETALQLEEACLQQLQQQLTETADTLQQLNPAAAQQRLAGLEDTAAAARTAAAEAEVAASDAQLASAAHRKQLKAQQRKLKSASEEADAARQALDGAQQHLQAVSEALQRLQTEAAAAPDGMHGAADRQSQHAAADEAASSDSDEEEAPRRTRRRIQGGCSRGSCDSGAGMSLKGVLSAAEEHTAALASLEERRAGIDCDALEADLACMQRSTELAAITKAAQEKLSRLDAEKEALVQDRFRVFDEAMSRFNQHLGRIYRQLTAQQGDAYVSYCNDPTLCFVTGTTLHIRPDSQRWRPFQQLSGGQQALLSSALSFALQVTCPLPLYYFDEIDAALDTANVERIADYLAAQHDAQYLLVTHRPQMYERAGVITGVYPSSAGSKAVVLRCDRSGTA